MRQASGCADGWESSSPPNIETISRFGDIKITLIELEGTGLKVERVYYPIIIGGLIARICSRLSRLRPMFPAKTASYCLQSEPPGNPLPVCCPLSLQSGAFPRILTKSFRIIKIWPNPLFLKDSAIKIGGGGENRTREYRFCKPAPYHLATPP